MKEMDELKKSCENEKNKLVHNKNKKSILQKKYFEIKRKKK